MWNRGIYEAALFAALSFLWPTIVVYHNPVSNRANSKVESILQSTLVRHARCVLIHSHRYFAHIRSLNGSTFVLPHPPYENWRQAHFRATHDEIEPTEKGVLFLGQVRQYKGAEDLPAIIQAFSQRRIKVRIVSFGRPALDLWRRYEDFPDVEFWVDSEPLSDERVADALRMSQLLIAPYVNATQSGTISLAFTVGVSTIAYESGAISDMLTTRSLTAPDPLSLVDRVIEWMDERWNTYKQTPEQVTSECLAVLTDLAEYLSKVEHR